MKKIVRPESTTVVFELLFHEIKSIDELRNILIGVAPKDISVFRRYVDPDTFQPLIAFQIKANDLMYKSSQTLSYTVEMGQLYDAKIDKKIMKRFQFKY